MFILASWYVTENIIKVKVIRITIIIIGKSNSYCVSVMLFFLSRTKSNFTADIKLFPDVVNIMETNASYKFLYRVSLVTSYIL